MSEGVSVMEQFGIQSSKMKFQLQTPPSLTFVRATSSNLEEEFYYIRYTLSINTLQYNRLVFRYKCLHCRPTCQIGYGAEREGYHITSLDTRITHKCHIALLGVVE